MAPALQLLARAAACALLCAAAARAGTFRVVDTWTYVSGTAVTVGGELQQGVYHDATTGPTGNFKVKLTIATQDAAASGMPVASHFIAGDGKSFQAFAASSFIRVVGATPLGAPVTTGFSIGPVAYTNTNAAAPGITSKVEIVLSFDSKTTDVAGTTVRSRASASSRNALLRRRHDKMRNSHAPFPFHRARRVPIPALRSTPSRTTAARSRTAAWPRPTRPRAAARPRRPCSCASAGCPS